MNVPMQIIGKGFQDPDKKVRGQAMFALGELAAHCQPEMSKHASEALPHVFAAMAEDDATAAGAGLLCPGLLL